MVEFKLKEGLTKADKNKDYDNNRMFLVEDKESGKRYIAILANYEVVYLGWPDSNSGLGWDSRSDFFGERFHTILREVTGHAKVEVSC